MQPAETNTEGSFLLRMDSGFGVFIVFLFSVFI